MTSSLFSECFNCLDNLLFLSRYTSRVNMVWFDLLGYYEGKEYRHAHRHPISATRWNRMTVHQLRVEMTACLAKEASVLLSLPQMWESQVHQLWDLHSTRESYEVQINSPSVSHPPKVHSSPYMHAVPLKYHPHHYSKHHPHRVNHLEVVPAV